MSLVGSLEDLGLGDILQIISLSRKSGVLVLRSEHGEGQILFREGRVTGAFRKGDPADLHGLLVGTGALSEDDFRAAVRAARAGGTDLETALSALPALGSERLDGLRKTHVERAAFAMFSWSTGEFSFEVREDADGLDPDLCVAQGIDAQYLAMEGARLRDEEHRDLPAPADRSDPASFADLGAELREEVPGAPEPEEVVLEAELLLEVEAVAEVEALVEAEPDHELAEPMAEVVAEPAARADTPVVVVDPSLPVLEWAKRALDAAYERIHIFQKTELAIARIRQYLVRRVTPVVVLSEVAPPDPNSGARTPAEIIRRLKTQAPRMAVLLLCEPPGDASGVGADAAVARPTQSDLYNQRRAHLVKDLGEALRAAVERHRGAPRGERARGGPVEPHALRRLKEVSDRLREAAPRGEILPMVMRFAAEHFNRVALFLVRDDLAVGMTQHGLAAAGGPDDAALREIALPAGQPAWFRDVFQRRASVRGPVRDEGDRRLAALLGDREPPEAYVAPLESGDRVVALLYADNLPDAQPLGDTAALEVVLHEAGLALDRAALERRLAEAESGGV